MDKHSASRSPRKGTTGKSKSPARVSQGSSTSSKASRRSSQSPKPQPTVSKSPIPAQAPAPAGVTSYKVKSSLSKTSTTSNNYNTTSIKPKTASFNSNNGSGPVKKRRSRSQLPSRNINASASRQLIGSNNNVAKLASPRDSLQLYDKNPFRAMANNSSTSETKSPSPTTTLNQINTILSSGTKTPSARSRADSVPASTDVGHTQKSEKKLSLTSAETEGLIPIQLPLLRSPRQSSLGRGGLTQASVLFRQKVMQAVAVSKSRYVEKNMKATNIDDFVIELILSGS